MKKKLKAIVAATILAIFFIMVKVLNLDSNQMITCIVFYELAVNLYLNFNFFGSPYNEFQYYHLINC